jgi:hypothetical protein
MTRSRVLPVVLVALAANLGPFPAAAGAGVGAGATRAQGHLLVFAQEWSLWPSRTTLPAGAVSVELDNRGQDAHDLRLQRIGRGGRLTGAPSSVRVTQSGALGHGSWRLRAGRYLLFCSLPGHRARGMHTVLVVR